MLAAKVKIEPGQLLIDGQWVDGAKKFDTINPCYGRSVDADRGGFERGR